MKIRKITEKFAEGVLFTSSTVTTITVLFIIFFLFKSGIGIFRVSPMDAHYELAVHQNNPVVNMSSQEVMKIFNRDITNWSDLGGKNQDIFIFMIHDVSNFFTMEELGDRFQYLSLKIGELIEENENIIVYLDRRHFPEDFKGTFIQLPNISAQDLFLGTDWFPTIRPAAQFGFLPLILGTLQVTFFAILFALPIGLITAIYLAEVASNRVRRALKPLIELLASIPSVVYGFFGLVVLVPFIQELFDLPVGETALTGAIVLAIMALPTIITISEDSLRTTPRTLKEASLSLGASHWQSIIRVTIPYASSGIMAAFILGIGRAIGETMAVLMVTGNAAIIPSSLLEPVRTIPATIAAELGEAPFGGTHFEALFMLGIILFIITFIFNTLVEVIKARNIKQ